MKSFRETVGFRRGW